MNLHFSGDIKCIAYCNLLFPLFVSVVGEEIDMKQLGMA